jgi:endogenous inhibitor of DNA gyrase (YacG/DUF329 family)
VKTVACPRCGGASVFARDNRWRPFCSERCKMIDLGAWAAESYRVAAEEEELPEDGASSTPPGS